VVISLAETPHKRKSREDRLVDIKLWRIQQIKGRIRNTWWQPDNWSGQHRVDCGRGGTDAIFYHIESSSSLEEFRSDAIAECVAYQAPI